MIRTRFAPSPTGLLHLGGARTAIYAYLLAHHYGGKFILRIEDTDQTRSHPRFTSEILDALEWLGLQSDEGPYFQSQRFDRYHALLEQLLTEGHAYPCDCTIERLQNLRNHQISLKQKPRYDGRCRHRSFSSLPIHSKVIRFRNPESGLVVIEDKALGTVEFDNEELDDFVLTRSDGTPTYNFTVVVDDYDMAITHVIRGNDHLNNTPRQVNVLRALGAPIPVYTHLPMIHAENGGKLSKREGAISVTQYREAGFLPEAVVNYLARLGWSHGNQEIFSREELIRYFDGQHLSKSPASLNNSKLVWLNQHYLKHMEPSDLQKALKPFIKDWQPERDDRPSLSELILVQRDRVKTLLEMAEKSRYFYESPQDVISISSELLPTLNSLRERLENLEIWEKSLIYAALQETVAQSQLKPNQLFQPLRHILLGSSVSPPIDITFQLLGKTKVLQRLQKTLEVSSSEPL